VATRSDHPLFAAWYDRLLLPAERAGLAERRARLLRAAHGRVLEVGGGTGLNLAHYSARPVAAGGVDAVDRVDVIEPDAAMRRRLEPRAAAAPVPVQVHPGGVDDPFPAPTYDTIVCSLVLCTVPDLDRAVARLHEALAPDGRLLFLEHVRSYGWWGRVQHAATPAWSRLMAGCRLDRDVLGALRRGGFLVSDVDHFRMPRSCGLVHHAVAGTAVDAIRKEVAPMAERSGR
jgi:SAM-dependent methyltransferase